MILAKIKGIQKSILTHEAFWLWGVAAALVVLRLFYVHVGPLDLAPDEAHYWEFSRHLDWSYYSKPPLIAWLIALSTSVLGDTEVGVRFFAAAGMSLVSVMAFMLLKAWRGVGTAWLGFAAINLTPLFAGGAILMAPDVPCTVLWLAGILLLSRVPWEKYSAAYMGTFVTLGVVIGFAGLAKYTAALFYPLLGLFLLVDPKRRVWLQKKEVYVAGLISLAMTLPVFYWNMTHEWVGFKHVLGQAGATTTVFEPLKTVGNFLGGQLGVMSPVTFVLMLCAWVYGYTALSGEKGVEKKRIAALLWWFSAPVFMFFVVKSFGAKVQPNWPVLASLGGLLFMLGWLQMQQKRWVKPVFYAGLALSTLLTVVTHDTQLIRPVLAKAGVDVSFKRDPLKPVLGWQGLGVSLSAVLQGVYNPVILTSRYQTASELAFYVEGQPDVMYVNPGYRRQNQYDYWPWPEDLAQKTVIYVREGGEIEPHILRAFKMCAPIGRIASNRGEMMLRTAHVYACGGYLGLDRQMPERY